MVEPVEIRTYDVQQLEAEFGDEDWALFPPIPYGPYQDRVLGRLEPLRPPDGKHWLGTDDKGRDLLSRLIHGARVSMLVGFVAVFIYVFIGIVVGALAGYFGGITDILLSRVMEVVICFPVLFAILAVFCFLSGGPFYRRPQGLFDIAYTVDHVC